MDILEMLLGSPGQTGSTYNKNQRSLLDEVLQSIKGKSGQDITQQPAYQSGLDWLQGLFNNPDFFNQFEAPLQRQYQEQTIPDLANRFASMGSGGALGSTGFRNQLAREGSNLSTNLGALRGNLQQQGVNQALGYAQAPFNQYQSLLNTALTPTQNVYQPPSAGLLGGILPGLAGGLGQGFGQQFGQNFANRFPGQNSSTF